MTFTFKRAVRAPLPIIAGVAGPSGSGKTFSLLRMARGIAGPNGRIAFIDTEQRRALHYADAFEFDHTSIGPPYEPARFTDAIKAAELAKYDVIIVDSISHEWIGDGGCQDMHDDAVERMAKGDEAKAERVSVLAWSKPKQAHKKLMSHILQMRTHILFGLRAENKLTVNKKTSEYGKKEFTEFGAPQWIPICEKHFMFEMMVSVLLDPQRPGVPIPIKVQDQHKFAFPNGEQLTEQTGVRLLSWAGAGSKKTPKELTLRAANGAPVKTYENAGGFLNALEKALNDCDTRESLQAIWDSNMDLFFAIQDTAHKKDNKAAIGKCNTIGKYLADKMAKFELA